MLHEDKIAELTSKGFTRWSKDDMDRLYISAAALGLKYELNKSGAICSASFRGQHISNRSAARYRRARTYVDVKTGRIFSVVPALADAARELAGIPCDRP